MTSPAGNTEPTAEQVAAAMEVVRQWDRGDKWDTLDVSIHALADLGHEFARALAAAYKQGYDECHFDGHVNGAPQ